MLNVGIGTTSPEYNLDVSGTGRFTGDLTVSGASTNFQNAIKAVDGSGSGVDADLLDGLSSNQFTRGVQASVPGINSSTWTTIGFVNGSGLNSKIRLSAGGTSNSVVVSSTVDIIVNHSHDFILSGISGDYSTLTLKLLSTGNEDFYIQAKHNGPTTTTLNVTAIPFGGETITLYTDNPTVDPAYTSIKEFTLTENALSVSSNVVITGSLSKGSGTFLIDHPLDPENLVLRHSFVESPEPMLVYKGRTELVDGEAVVELPDYFDALNRDDDIEYSLTPVGSLCSLAVKEELKGNSFVVMGDRDCEFSWVVYSVRDDPFIRENPIVVEEKKGVNNEFVKGKCLHEEACE